MREHLFLEPDQEGWVRLLRWKATLHPEHCHYELECNLIHRGSDTYLIDGEAVELSQGDLIWLHPDQRHILINQSQDIHAWLLVIRPQLAGRLASELPEASDLTAGSIAPDRLCRRLAPKDFQHCCNLFQDLSTLPDQRWLNNALPALVGRLWLGFQRGNPIPRRQLDPLVRAAKAAIDADPSEVHRDHLAAELGCSPATLSGHFAQQTGQSLTDYRNYLRLLMSLASLEHSEEPVLNIALAAGFGSYPQFHRVFVKMMGMPPAQWRKQRREPNERLVERDA
jgi:AraC-like DNA-binding protein